MMKTNNSNETILITGIKGFIGTNLVNYFGDQDSIRLYGLDLFSNDLSPGGKIFNWEQLNKLPKVDTVIHLAGKAHDTNNKTNHDIYFDINTGLTKKIYDWFLYSNASKFIFFSSVKAAADVVLDDALTEEVNPKPVGPYGESKLAAERYILDNTISNKAVYILRPCMIHGPGNKGNLTLLYKVVTKGFPWPLGSFNNKRSFCSIGNLNFVVQKIVENDIESGIYNIADDLPLSTNNIIRLIAESVQKPPRIYTINKDVINIISYIGNILRLPLNQERLKKLTENYVVSNDKIKKALGIERMPIDAKKGMLETLRSFKD
jgi:nucleoside-diphosphate-sugar epimerase